MNHLILRACGQVVLPVALALSLILLWRGHNDPGGGFIGGLMAAAGFAVYALPRGRVRLLELLPLPPAGIAGAGLCLALASGLPGLLLDTPFLTHQWQVWDSGFALGTTLLFDVGVYLAVIGAVLVFLSNYLDE